MAPGARALTVSGVAQSRAVARSRALRARRVRPQHGPALVPGCARFRREAAPSIPEKSGGLGRIVVAGCAAGITVQLGGSMLAGAADP